MRGLKKNMKLAARKSFKSGIFQIWIRNANYSAVIQLIINEKVTIIKEVEKKHQINGAETYGLPSL